MNAGVMSRVRGWEHFWFEEVPPDTYALLRIALGLMGLAGLVGLTPVSMFWPLDSLSTVPGGGLGVRELIGAAGLGTITGWMLYAVLMASFVCMVVGYRSGVAVAIAFAASVAQNHWNSLPLSSSHQLLVSLLFCLMWVDSGGVMSLDARNGRRTQPLTFRTRAIWPMRLLRAQIAVIYLNTGLWKLFGPVWRDGSAGYDVLQLNVFHRFPGVVPDSLDWLVTAATYGTVLWEISFFALILNRWTRPIALVTGVLVHLGLWLTLELGTFSMVMLAGYLAFVDPHWIARKIGSRSLAPARLPQLDASLPASLGSYPPLDGQAARSTLEQIDRIG